MDQDIAAPTTRYTPEEVAVRESQVTEQLSRLADDIERIDNLAGRLEDRLTGVLRPADLTATLAESKVDEIVPLASLLRTSRHHLQGLGDRLSGMLDRLEV